jgi:hypothetical protein
MEQTLQRAHRYGYDHAMFLCGTRVTEVVKSGGKTQQFPPVSRPGRADGMDLNEFVIPTGAKRSGGTCGAPRLPHKGTGVKGDGPLNSVNSRNLEPPLWTSVGGVNSASLPP